MRNAFVAELTRLAQEDPRIVLLSGDIGNTLFDGFKKIAQDRFINCGIAEQNMMGVAAGMALSGLRPIVYTITPFATTRCFEQIRTSVCYHEAPVIIIGTGAGLSYSELGATHHSLEDIAILRTLPHMTVMAPGDPIETRLALRAALQQGEPTYIRIGKQGEPSVHSEEPEFQIGKAIVIRKGKDVVLLSTGNMLPETIKAADRLMALGLSAEVVSFHTVKPLDKAYLSNIKRFKLIATIEEHGLIGGFNEAVLSEIAQHGHIPMLAFGKDDTFIHEIGTQDYSRKQAGLSADHIVKEITKEMDWFYELS